MYFQLLVPAPESFETRVPDDKPCFLALTLDVGLCPVTPVHLVFIDPLLLGTGAEQ